MVLFAQNASNGSGTTLTVENDSFIRSEIQRLNAELAQLEQLSPQKTSFDTPLEERRIYAQRVVDVLAQIEALELKLKEGDLDREGLDTAQTGSGTGRVLILTEILHRGKPHRYAGYEHKNCGVEGCDGRERKSVTRVEGYPSVIRLDETFDVFVTNSIHYRKAKGVYTTSTIVGPRLKVDVQGLASSVEKGTTVPRGKDYAASIKEKASVRMSFEPLPIKPPPANMRHLRAGTASFVFSSESLDGDRKRGTISNKGKKISFHIPAKGQEPSKLPALRINVNDEWLTLIYRWGKADDTPATAEQIPDDGDGSDEVADGDNDGDGSDTANGSAGDDNQSASADGQGDADGANNQLSPDNPDVRRLITEWINSAEPPDNARIGANLRYENWGRVHGTTPSGVITLNGPPDYAGSYPSHFNYLWDSKHKLDSVDHCTLGEFVDIRLINGSIGSCHARYKPEVPDMVGMNAKQAQQLLTQRKLSPQFQLGEIPDSPEKEMTVASQSSPAGSSLAKQSKVQIKVYGKYVETITIPDVTGKPIAEAKTELENEGFDVSISLGSEPVSEAQGKTVEAQNPPAGTTVKDGEQVALTVYDVYVEKHELPNLVGKTREEAESLLTQSGLIPDFRTTPEAETEAEGNRVVNQIPEAGTVLKVDSVVTVTVKPPYDPMTSVPSLVQLSASQAKAALEKAKLRAYEEPAGKALYQYESEKVIAQSIAPGQKVTKGTLVIYQAYSKYVPPVYMPSVVGLKVRRAKSRLKTSKLPAPRVIKGEMARTLAEADKIYQQSIPAGSEVEPNTQLTVVIYDGTVVRRQQAQRTIGALAAGLAVAAGTYAATRGTYTSRMPTSSFNNDPEAHHLPNYGRTRTNNTARTIGAVVSGLAAMGSTYANSQPRNNPPPRQPSGITTNQSRQQMARTNVSGSVVENNTRYEKCVIGYTGAQQPATISFSLGGLSNGQMTVDYNSFKFNAGNTLLEGTLQAYYNPQRKSQNETLHVYSLVKSSGLNSFNVSKAHLGGRGDYKVIESPTRHAYIMYRNPRFYAAKYPNSDNDLRGLACKILSSLERYAAPKSQAASQTNTTQPKQRQGNYGAADPLDLVSPQSAIFGME